MKAFIFAAGIGSRLKPWTDKHPKALAPIGDITLLDNVIKKLSLLPEITEIIINIHHFGEQIRDHICRNPIYSNIIISDESSKLLDTGGALLKVADICENEDILAHNVDIVSNYDMAEMIKFHKEISSEITLFTSDRDTTRKLLFDNRGFLVGWTNTQTGEIKPPHINIDINNITSLAFNGVQILSSTAIRMLKEFNRTSGKDVFSVIDYYLWAMNKINISSFVPTGDFKWIDAGKPAALELANTLFKYEE